MCFSLVTATITPPGPLMRIVCLARLCLSSATFQLLSRTDNSKRGFLFFYEQIKSAEIALTLETIYNLPDLSKKTHCYCHFSRL